MICNAVPRSIPVNGNSLILNRNYFIAMKYNTDNRSNSQNEPMFNFGAIFAKYKRYWWLFALSFVGCMCLAAFYIYVKKPVYLVASQVLISSDGTNGGSNQLLKSLSLGAGGASVDDEAIVFNSHDLRTKMISELKINRSYAEKVGFMKKRDLYNETPIAINAPDELFDTLSISMMFKIKVSDNGKKVSVKVKKGLFNSLTEVEGNSLPLTVKTNYGIFVLNKTDKFKEGTDYDIVGRVYGNNLMYEAFKPIMSVTISSKKANGISLYLEETNVKRGIDVLNKLVDLYNKRCQLEKDETALNTAKFIDERLAIIYNELSTSEADIEQYKKNNNLVDVEVQARQLLSKKESYEGRAIQYETQRELLKMILNFLNDKNNSSSMIPFNPNMGELVDPISEYNKIVVQRINMSASARPDNVMLKELDNQIASVRENLITSIGEALKSVEASLAASNKERNSALSNINDVPSMEREYRELFRRQTIKNSLYTFLLEKREENALVLAATTPKGKIVDNAYSSVKPIEPKTSIVLFTALLFSIVIPIFVIYLKQLFNTKFSTQDELQEIARTPVIGEICHNRHKRKLVVRPQKTSSIVELFRLIRTNIQFMLSKESNNVILVTSSVSGEGKSFVSTNIAASFALLGKKVALVGMDIRSPKLAEYLELKAAPGVTAYLSKNNVTIDEIAQKLPEIDGLDVYVGGVIPPNPSELLQSERLSQFINELRQRYDMVFIDSAPVAMVSDSLSLVGHADAVVYVTRANYTKRSLVKYANDLVARGQLRNVAMVINDTTPSLSAGYGYGYASSDDDE